MKKFCKPYIDLVQEKIKSTLNINLELSSAQALIENTMRGLIINGCIKPLIYCLNIERMEERLIGETTKDRYDYFSTIYCSNSITRYFPTLTQQLTIEIAPKVQYVIEVIEAFYKDATTLLEMPIDTTITNINSAGDWHENKSVVIITLSSGVKLVYKPTLGSNISLFQRIASIFFSEEYAALYHHHKSEAGTWIKYIEHHHTTSENECKNFYHNYGKILFLSYTLGINDLHCENMIACGIYPYIADLETIFSSFVNGKTKRYTSDSHRQIIETLMFGINASGLLPILSLNDYFGGDISCLSNRAINIIVDTIIDEYTDTMKIVPEKKTIQYTNHLPQVDINPLAFVDQICEGFRDGYNIFCENRTELIALLSKYIKDIDCRVIINMTKAYAQIVRMKNEIKYRRNNDAYIELIDRLKTQDDFNEIVFQHEKEELINGNIPKFYWNVELNKISYSQFGESKPIVSFPSVNREDVLSTITTQLEEQKIEQQLAHIENTINTCRLMTDKEYMEIFQTDQAKKNNGSKLSISNTCDMILSNIFSQAVLGNDNTIGWIGMNITANEELTYEALNTTIYNGTTGIGLLFLELFKKSNDNRFLDILKRIVNNLRIQIVTREFQVMPPSYFTGLTGIYSLLSNIEDANITIEDITELKEKITELIKQQIGEVGVYDTLYGIHSIVIFFYGKYIMNCDDTAKEILELLNSRFKQTFNSKNVVDNTPASFAHGYSGMITSLLCMYRYTNDNWYLDTAMEVQILENRLNSEMFEWIDLRDKDRANHSHFWCHGSCGMMISKLLRVNLGLLDNFKYPTKAVLGDRKSNLDEVGTYIEAILTGKYNTKNFTLCHGNFAFVDLIISYCKITQCELSSGMEGYIYRTIDEASQLGFNCFIPGTTNAIGLFVGESGILFELLRFQNPEAKSPLNLGCF